MAASRSARETRTRPHLQGLRGLRQALSAAHLRLDRAAPVMETRDVAIAGPAGPLPLRLYRPREAPPTGPAIVFFHGGGFVICDVETHDSLCRRLADASGLPLLSVDYRLAPEAPFPAQLDDGEAAVRWAIDHAGALGLDPSRLLLAGDSAGGYMAVALAARLNAERVNAEQPRAVAGLVLLYPLLELDDDAWASSVFAHARVVGRVAVGYIRNQLGPQIGAAASLVGVDPALIPPTIIAAGGHLDPCRPDARRFAERLRAAGRPVALVEHPRLPHGFGSITHVSLAARRATAEVGAAAKALADGEAIDGAVRSAGGGRPRGRRAPAGRRG